MSWSHCFFPPSQSEWKQHSKPPGFLSQKGRVSWITEVTRKLPSCSKPGFQTGTLSESPGRMTMTFGQRTQAAMHFTHENTVLYLHTPEAWAPPGLAKERLPAASWCQEGSAAQAGALLLLSAFSMPWNSTSLINSHSEWVPEVCDYKYFTYNSVKVCHFSPSNWRRRTWSLRWPVPWRS